MQHARFNAGEHPFRHLDAESLMLNEFPTQLRQISGAHDGKVPCLPAPLNAGANAVCIWR